MKNLKKTLGCLAVMNAQRFRRPLIRKTSKEVLWDLKGPISYVNFRDLSLYLAIDT